MSIETVPVQAFLQLSVSYPIVDVRSPAEYAHAHIPGAFSLPLFTDEERAVVGKTYHHRGRLAAIRTGLDFYGPKMRRLAEQAEAIVHQHSPDRHTILLHCWRGGMRSRAVAWLLDLMGYSVHLLQGGYKAFRREVLQTFTLPLPLRLLGGYTGSGKTRFLQAMQQKGLPVIDLEQLACHKGSAFGDLGMPLQPSQEMFENLLAMHIRRCLAMPNIAEKAIWMEDESQRIGDLVIPNPLWMQMRKAPLYFLELPFSHRLQQVVDEYGIYDIGLLEAAILRIRKRLGGVATQQALDALYARQMISCFTILLRYYDKLYDKSLLQRESDVPIFRLPMEISCADELLRQLMDLQVTL
ncbi:MAG: tRNA 2-selenouridine(34) synthase MnmH [Thermoflavifilum sp.]|nr:tRNA 2-selenouridine(34) synthase MnmH [Thermoflavifilum sp.]